MPLVEGKKVTSFTNSEEAAAAAGLRVTGVVPFLVEDELKAKAATSHAALSGRPTWCAMAC